MFKKQCRCGAIEKSFKIDIGPFFISECCEKAGYDEKGQLIGEDGEIVEDEVQEPEAPANPYESAPEVVAGASENKTEGSEQEETVIAEDFQAPASEEVQAPAVDLEKLGHKALQDLCKERGIEFKGNDSKDKLREKLK